MAASPSRVRTPCSMRPFGSARRSGAAERDTRDICRAPMLAEPEPPGSRTSPQTHDAGPGGRRRCCTQGSTGCSLPRVHRRLPPLERVVMMMPMVDERALHGLVDNPSPASCQRPSGAPRHGVTAADAVSGRGSTGAGTAAGATLLHAPAVAAPATYAPP